MALGWTRAGQGSAVRLPVLTESCSTEDAVNLAGDKREGRFDTTQKPMF